MRDEVANGFIAAGWLTTRRVRAIEAILDMHGAHAIDHQTYIVPPFFRRKKVADATTEFRLKAVLRTQILPVAQESVFYSQHRLMKRLD